MNKISKIVALALSLIMVFALASCSTTVNNAPSDSSTDAPAANNDAPAANNDAPAASNDAPAASNDAPAASAVTTVNPGKLTVATSPDFAPYEFYSVGADGTMSLAGFDIALAQYIADYMGLELEIVTVDFDGVLMELQTKSVDLGLAGLSADPKRAGIMDFSTIYYEGGQSFVTTQANKDKFATLDDTNKADVSVGAQIGSIQVDLAEKFSPDADIVKLVKVTDIIAELITGKLDGAYIETAVAENYAKNYPDLAIVLDVPYEDSEGSAVGVQKDNPELLAAVNAAVEQALADGSMAKFIAEANELSTGDIYEGLLEG